MARAARRRAGRLRVASRVAEQRADALGLDGTLRSCAGSTPPGTPGLAAEIQVGDLVLTNLEMKRRGRSGSRYRYKSAKGTTPAVRFDIDGEEHTTTLGVLKDPTSSGTRADIEAQVAFSLRMRDRINEVTEAITKMEHTRVQLQAAAAAAFTDQAHMMKNVAAIVETRDRVAGELKQRGYTVFPSAANFLWVKPPADTKDVFKRLREKNILVRHFPGEKTGDYLRITIGTDKQMDALLAALK